jgi:hypothetical protein
MASQEPSVQFDENEEHSQILEKDSIFEFNEFVDSENDKIVIEKEEELTQIDKYIEEASQQANIEANLEEKYEQEESQSLSILQEVEIEDDESEQPVEPVEPVEPKRPVRTPKPSKIVIENEQQKKEKEEQARLDFEAKLKEAKKKEEQERKTLALASVGSIVSDSGNETDISTDTIATGYIIPNIRLETYNPTSQASMIFGNDLIKNVDGETPCSLCGFKLKDRISYWHNKIHNPDDLEKLTWSYDHFVPVNFSAVVFRIPTSKSNFDDQEKEYLKDIGHIACFHCNYEKSQRMFITCPSKGTRDFNNFQPNEKSITNFVNDLYKSQNKNGWSKEGDIVKKTLTKCLRDLASNEHKHYTTWIRERIGAITKLADKVCNLIKNNTDHDNIKKRYKLAKRIIAKANETLKTDEKYKAIAKPKKKTSFRRAYIANIFASAELQIEFPKPWKLAPAPITNPTPDSEVTNNDPSKKRRSSRVIVSPTVKSPRVDGSSRKRKNKRKTYRGVRLF